MRRLLFLVILVPLAVLIVVLSVANRETVSVSLDPFHGAAPALSFTAPLFVIVFAALFLGVLLGGFATWIRQGRWRRAARRAEAEADRLRLETVRTRPSPAVTALPPRRDAA